MQSPVSIEVKQLGKTFGHTIAVDRIDLRFEPGLLYVLLGPSGCGKTTTLRIIAGLETPSSGAVHIDGIDVTDVPVYQRDLGFVFQQYALFPHMNVESNVGFGLRMRRLPKRQVSEAVSSALALVQLTGLEQRLPRQLSGGQQQRVALARALVTQPRALLLDEPLSNLDKNLRDEMRGQIRSIQQRLGITTVMVTHDQAEALDMADRIVVINSGRIEQVGTPIEIYRRPLTLFAARFVGAANVIAGTLSGDGHLVASDQLRFRVSNAWARSTDRAALILRPADIALAPAEDGPSPQGLLGVIKESSYQGSVRRHRVVMASGREITADVPDHGALPLGPGVSVSIGYDAELSHVLLDPADHA